MNVMTNTEEAAFPSICFWNRKAPPILLVNSSDFKRDDLLKKLDLDGLSISATFGTKDRDEIIRRQRTVRFLTEHPEIRGFLTENTRKLISSAQLPSRGQEFLDGFWINLETEHNQFFTMVQKFVEQLHQIEQLPSEIAEFWHFLTDTKTGAEALENDLGREMGEEIQKATVFQGTAWIRVKAATYRNYDSWSISSSEMYGYQKYSYHLSGHCDPIKKPKWLEKSISRFLGISKLVNFVLRGIDKHRHHRRFADLLIVGMPEELEKAILNFAQEKFSKGIEALSKYDDAYFNLYFHYENDDLTVQLVHFYSCLSSEEMYGYGNEKKDHEKSVRSPAPVISDDYLGYSRRQLRKIVKQNELIADSVAERSRQSAFSMRFFNFIESTLPDILRAGTIVTTTDLEARFKWYTIEGLRHSSRFAERCEKMTQYRFFVADVIRELNEVSCVVDRLVAKSEEWNLPLCFPVILSNAEHVVSFDQLMPVHLIGRRTGEKEIRPDSLIPISSLASLNGRMIGLTGQNAGGKTVTKEAIVATIYLAQSGLPVFGKNVALNAKSTLGLVFLERGEGATLELMLKKTGKVLEAVQNSSENGIVVFLDEVGTGTQESAGLKLGERILAKLGKSGCSIVFSTQITDLARKAETEMNALCYQVDLKHRIRPGIGIGGADLLAERLGVDKLL